MKPLLLIHPTLWMCVIILLMAGAQGVHAADTIQISVEVIHASRNGTTVDPGLEALVKEVSPVLNFKGFALLKRSELRLAPNDQDEINLPGQRKLAIQFLEFSESKARVSVRILEKEKESFRTVLLLVDQGTALIGGPPHEDGVLLLRIGARF